MYNGPAAIQNMASRTQYSAAAAAPAPVLRHRAYWYAAARLKTMTGALIVATHVIQARDRSPFARIAHTTTAAVTAAAETESFADLRRRTEGSASPRTR